MVDRTVFTATLSIAFPSLSYGAATKCWNDVRALPSPALAALHAGLRQAAEAAAEARRSEAAAIASSIGVEARVR